MTLIYESLNNCVEVGFNDPPTVMVIQKQGFKFAIKECTNTHEQLMVKK